MEVTTSTVIINKKDGTTSTIVRKACQIDGQKAVYDKHARTYTTLERAKVTFRGVVKINGMTTWKMTVGNVWIWAQKGENDEVILIEPTQKLSKYDNEGAYSMRDYKSDMHSDAFMRTKKYLLNNAQFKKLTWDDFEDIANQMSK